MSDAEAERPIAQACFWMAQTPQTAAPALDGEHRADVAIVGAGLTGLWTALYLKQLDPGLSVAVLEQEHASFGASGRNAGMLIETIDHGLELSVAHFGEEEAARLAVLGRDNLRDMLALLAARGIACDVEQTGLMQVALVPAHLALIESEVEHAHRMGLTHYSVLSAEETRAELRCQRYLGAMLNPNCAVLDPVKLVLGLRADALRSGTAVFEGTRVTQLARDEDGVVLTTPGGQLRARRAILATNAYTHLLVPMLRFRYLPLYDYMLASEPLTEAQQEAIGWRRRQGFADSRSFFKYYRLSADNRVIWGTSEAVYHPPNRVDAGCDHSPAHYQQLRESFARHFPQLADLRFPYAWGGPIDATTRFTPFFGRAMGGRVLYGLGFTGHGLGTTHLAGKILSHMALEQPCDLLDLQIVRKPPFPYPPEPLRRLAVGMVTKRLRRVDQGGSPTLLLRLFAALGIGFKS